MADFYMGRFRSEITMQITFINICSPHIFPIVLPTCFEVICMAKKELIFLSSPHLVA